MTKKTLKGSAPIKKIMVVFDDNTTRQQKKDTFDKLEEVLVNIDFEEIEIFFG